MKIAKQSPPVKRSLYRSATEGGQTGVRPSLNLLDEVRRTFSNLIF